jgi:hypothetical protein
MSRSSPSYSSVPPLSASRALNSGTPSSQHLPTTLPTSPFQRRQDQHVPYYIIINAMITITVHDPRRRPFLSCPICILIRGHGSPLQPPYVKVEQHFATPAIRSQLRCPVVPGSSSSCFSTPQRTTYDPIHDPTSYSTLHISSPLIPSFHCIFTSSF